VIIAPSSRGIVTLASADPEDLPIIHPNWLADPADQELAVAAYKRAREAFHSEALAPIIDGEEVYPGASITNDKDILDKIRESVITLWHPACTCRMGKQDDPMAVLDSECRVRGVAGLRVVDASSLPFLPPGHPQSSICKWTAVSHKGHQRIYADDSSDMLAEKIAEAMLKVHKLGKQAWHELP
jgi:choline dehydrogenase